MLKKRQKGSITVEASFLMPWIILLMVVLIWMAMTLHDRSIIGGAFRNVASLVGDYAVYEVDPLYGRQPNPIGMGRELTYALRGAAESDGGNLTERFKKIIGNQLFLYHIDNVSFQKNGMTVKANGRFSCLKLPWFSEWGLSHLAEYETEASFFYPVREEITRIGNVVINIIE